MTCNLCQLYLDKKLPIIKENKRLNIIPYFLRTFESKRKLMISNPVKIWKSLLVEKSINDKFKKKVAKEIYGLSNFPNINNYICSKCGKPVEVYMLKYIRHQIITKMFDFFSTNEQLLTDLEKQIIKKYLELYSNNIMCKDWKGHYFYFYKIFKVPYPLRNIVSPEKYQTKKKYNLEDQIYFHPKASDGFAQECWEAIDAYQNFALNLNN